MYYTDLRFRMTLSTTDRTQDKEKSLPVIVAL